MIVSVLKEKLDKGIAVVSRVVPAKPALPLLANILLEAKKGELYLSGTDLHQGIKLHIGAKVKKEGKITVPAKIFGDLVSSFPQSTVDLSLDGEALLVKCEGSKARLTGIDAGEFPILGKVSEKGGFSLPVNQFSQAIGMTAFAASADETRPVLSGVLWKYTGGKIQLVATDGYRLSISKVESSDKTKKVKMSKGVEEVLRKGIVIPSKALRDVERIISEIGIEEIMINVVSASNLVIFSFDEGEVVTRLVEGDFPDFEKVVPKEEKGVAEIELESLVKAVKTAAIFARDSANIVKWNMSKKSLTISSNAPTYGESESVVDLSLEGEGGEIAFNSRYLLELFSVFPGKTVRFSISGPLDPGVFRSDTKKGFLHLVMPVRVQK